MIFIMARQQTCYPRTRFRAN